MTFRKLCLSHALPGKSRGSAPPQWTAGVLGTLACHAQAIPEEARASVQTAQPHTHVTPSYSHKSQERTGQPQGLLQDHGGSG